MGNLLFIFELLTMIFLWIKSGVWRCGWVIFEHWLKQMVCSYQLCRSPSLGSSLPLFWRVALLPFIELAYLAQRRMLYGTSIFNWRQFECVAYDKEIKYTITLRNVDVLFFLGWNPTWLFDGFVFCLMSTGRLYILVWFMSIFAAAETEKSINCLFCVIDSDHSQRNFPSEWWKL
jgi:hypothetical protein